MPVCGASKAEAEDKMAIISKLPLEIDQLSLLAEALNFDFASKGIDEPFTTEELQGMQGMLGIRDGVIRKSGKANPTARDFIQISGRGHTESAVVGGPKKIADNMEEMFSTGGCDGFVVAATHVPGAYADFVRHVVPSCSGGAFIKRTTRAKPCATTLASPALAWGLGGCLGRRRPGDGGRNGISAPTEPAKRPATSVRRTPSTPASSILDQRDPSQAGQTCYKAPRVYPGRPHHPTHCPIGRTLAGPFASLVSVYWGAKVTRGGAAR